MKGFKNNLKSEDYDHGNGQGIYKSIGRKKIETLLSLTTGYLLLPIFQGKKNKENWFKKALALWPVDI